MVNHEIVAHFEVTTEAKQRAARIEARVIELLEAAICGDRPSFHERVEAKRLAPMLYRGVSALPAIIAQAAQEVG